MKVIFFITELLPEREEDLGRTTALYDLVKYWESVYIIRPYYPVKLSPFTFNIKRKAIYLTRFRNMKILHVPVFMIPLIKKYIFINPKIICSYLNTKPDIIAGHFFVGNRMSSHFSEKLGVPFTAGVHHSDMDLIINNQREYVKMIENADRIICRSENIKSKLISLNRNYESRIFVASSGIEENLIEPEDFFKKKIIHKANTKGISFITVARLVKLKNIDVNLDALAEFKEINWHYTIVGDGEETDNLRKQVQVLGLEKKVDFTGWLSRDKVMEKLKASDVYLQVSAPETFGLAYLEAMAKGCIVIGAKGWGIDGIIKHGINGFLVTPGNISVLKEILEKHIFISGTELLARFSKNIFQTIRSYTEKERSLKYHEMLEEIIEK